MPQSEAQYAVIDAATSGDNTLVAAVAGKRIRVLACALVAAGAVTAAFESHDGDETGVAVTGDLDMAADQSLVLGFNPLGWFQTAPGELLNLTLGGSVAVGGSLTYVLVD